MTGLNQNLSNLTNSQPLCFYCVIIFFVILHCLGYTGIHLYHNNKLMIQIKIEKSAVLSQLHWFMFCRLTNWPVIDDSTCVWSLNTYQTFITLPCSYNLNFDLKYVHIEDTIITIMDDRAQYWNSFESINFMHTHLIMVITQPVQTIHWWSCLTSLLLDIINKEKKLGAFE